MAGRKYTQEDEEWLLKNYCECTPEEAEQVLGRKWKNITAHCNENGIRRKKFINEKTFNLKKLSTTITVKEVAQMLGIAVQEVDIWLVVYPECIKAYNIGGKKRIPFDVLVKFLKNHQDLWDSTKMPDRCALEEYKWFEKKHEADFEKMIQSRWGKDAK